MRSIELIRGMLSTDRFNVHVVTNIPELVFKSQLFTSAAGRVGEVDDPTSLTEVDPMTKEIRYTHSVRNLDSGAVQQDIFTVDMYRTLDNYYNSIHLNRESLIRVEVEWLLASRIDLILIDATPLAGAVSRLSGIRSVLVSNFSWDFCYCEMLQDLQKNSTTDGDMRDLSKYSDMITQCITDCSHFSAYLQLPGETPTVAVQSATETEHSKSTSIGTVFHGVEQQINRIIPGPLIARPVRNRNLRAELPIPDCNTKILLLGFGGFSIDFPLQDSFLPAGWVCVVLGASGGLSMPSERFVPMGPDSYVPDLVHAADAVLGKIGYGFVSECISTGTPLVYVPRQHWPEERYLEKLLCESYRAGVRMSSEAFFAGSWKEFIELGASMKNSWQILEHHDCVGASNRIIEIIERQLSM